MGKIQENESIKPYLEFSKILQTSCQILDNIPFIYKINPKLKTTRNEIMSIVEESKVLALPDQFNEFFAKHGWVCYSALNQSILEQAVLLGSNNKIQEAKELLINYVDERMIDWIIKKCNTRKHFIDRLDLLKLLKVDYLEERYHSCIPLLLALIDGLANDISKHVSFFAEQSDLELYDSITSHETGLPFLKLIMNTSRTKTTTEEILIPFRNGILHGRDLNFANKEVASKCWWLLDCLIDWADEKSLQKQPSKQESLKETLKRYQETQEYFKRINKWEKRPILFENLGKSQILESLDQNSPEYTLVIFLSAWKAKQWGKMTPLLLNNIGKPTGKAIGEVKKDYQNIQLLNYQLKSSEDQTPAITRILVNLEYIKDDKNYKEDISISMNYADTEKGLPELRGEPNGNWYILQLSLRDILF